MILKSELKQIAQSQKDNLSNIEHGVEREKLKQIKLRAPHAIILSGLRRCGKSTLLHQLMKKTCNSCYFNFEDPRTIDFEVKDFENLQNILKELYGKCECYFFDEIQNVKKWELFVRKLLDRRKKVVITGSNASLLSRELGTRLTGRHLTHELFPFSFREFLKLKGEKPNIRSFKKYFENGGMPEYLKYRRLEILQELLKDIIIRDVVVKYKLRNAKVAEELAVYLLTNVGKEFSYNSLKKMFDFGSTNSIISLISYFEDSYLIFTIPKFDYSLKKQAVNPKKVYSIDNGLSTANSSSFSSDKGRMLENLAFLSLRKKYENIFYFRENRECDFVIKEGNKITKAIQVCYKLTPENEEREIKGLLGAMNKFKLKKGLILTFNQEDQLTKSNKKIIIKPMWKQLI